MIHQDSPAHIHAHPEKNGRRLQQSLFERVLLLWWSKFKVQIITAGSLSFSAGLLAKYKREKEPVFV